MLMANKLPKVSIVILNYNGWKDTTTCLESVFNIDYTNYHVIVVDNDSSDDSVTYMKKWALGELSNGCPFPDHEIFNTFHQIKKPISFSELLHEESIYNSLTEYNIKKKIFVKNSPSNKYDEKLIIIKNNKNSGYAGGNNVGIRYSIDFLNTDYIMILNNDTVVAPDIINKLLEVFALDKKMGICGPLEFSYNKPYSLQSAGGRFGIYTGMHKILRKTYDDVKEVDWVCGSCFLMRKELIPTIGYLDERYFLYVEEIDYAYRTNKSHYRVCVTTGTSIWHKGRTEGGQTSDELYDFYTIRNRLLFALKHLKVHQLFVFIPIHVTKWLLIRAIKDFIQGKEIHFSRKIEALKEGFLAYKAKSIL